MSGYLTAALIVLLFAFTILFLWLLARANARDVMRAERDPDFAELCRRQREAIEQLQRAFAEALIPAVQRATVSVQQFGEAYRKAMRR